MRRLSSFGGEADLRRVGAVRGETHEPLVNIWACSLWCGEVRSFWGTARDGGGVEGGVVVGGVWSLKEDTDYVGAWNLISRSLPHLSLNTFKTDTRRTSLSGGSRVRAYMRVYPIKSTSAPRGLTRGLPPGGPDPDPTRSRSDPIQTWPMTRPDPAVDWRSTTVDWWLAGGLAVTAIVDRHR
ncbi:hypothetical protein Tco_1034935 [Tanacetum coccineum]